MLRLKLRGTMIFNYPMEDRHMFFLRNAVRVPTVVSCVPALQY